MPAVLNCKAGTPFTNLALIAAKYGNVQVQSKPVADNKPISLQLENGASIQQPAAVARYLGAKNAQLLGGKQEVAQAQVLEWVFYALNDLHNAMCSWVLPATGTKQLEKGAADRAKNDVKQMLRQLNDQLLVRTYLVGERLSLADIAVAVTLLPLYQNVMDKNFRNNFGNVNRWFNTCINQKEFVDVLGKNLALCEKEPKGEAAASKKPAGAAEKKPAAAAAEEPQPVKENKDPFAAMPKGNWDMEDFKRFYSNNDEDKSVPYFWEKFDKENFSIWYCEYKYPTELTMVFMSCNLIGGMFQRLEKLRKNAFASVCLFGENNNSTISGIWVWKGQDLAFELSEDWQIDYGSYEWKKLDNNSEETKKLVNQYFKWEGTDKEGRKFNQGKIFK